jgi:outer membrane protein OmpA-like peptidoglycan-associated protein
MLKRFLIVCVAFSLSQSISFSEVFRFAYTKGEKYRIVSTVTETVSVNGRTTLSSDILDKIAVVVTDTRGGSGFHEVTYQTSERAEGTDGAYQWSEEYSSRFWQDARGACTIDDSYFMPMVRDVPLFPEGVIGVGQSWSAPGSEVHDLRANFGVAKAFHFPITVSYTYLRNEVRDGVNCAVFDISYTVFYKAQLPSHPSATYPARISGSSRQLYWWDIADGKPYYDEEQFDFLFSLAGGDEVEFSGQSRGRLVEAQPLDRDKAAREIQRDIEKSGIDNASVRVDEQGVTITLENVNFPPNSEALLPAEREKLRRIGEILKKYPDRDLVITGHTAAVAGYTEEEHQALSEKRATAVGNFILSQGARTAQQMTIKGMGDRVPLADNSTEEGRMRNRRVEITIVEN